ncbi:hypothetical protein ACIBI9_49290 [Nonomuraea sp. NPDC050451]|uniref:hypothetical protein n=1 Tax=Nonomuraea sp. NPDC050451 TaxID=3364364 RepID=UPI0037A84B8D
MPLTPGEPALFRFPLGSTGQVLKAGQEDLRPARQTVFHDAPRPSRLLLPVIPS